MARESASTPNSAGGRRLRPPHDSSGSWLTDVGQEPIIDVIANHCPVFGHAELNVFPVALERGFITVRPCDIPLSTSSIRAPFV